MKIKLFLSILAGTALSISAQGFKDGVEYYRADQPEEAGIILTNTLSHDATDRPTALYYLGQIALKQGNKAKAKEYFQKGISEDASNGYNYIGLGALELANGNTSAASGYFKDAKKYAKKDADMLTEIARVYFEADPVKYSADIDKAIIDAKKASKNAPAPFILEGDRLADTNVGEAAGMYEMAAQFDTKLEHPEAYVKYARTYFKVNPQFAIEKLKDLLKAQPNSALAQRELAEKYYDDHQLTRAAEQYEKYIQNPNHFPKDRQRFAGLLYYAKRYPESFTLASEMLKNDPANFYMQRLQFYNKKDMGENEAAKEYADKLFANPKAEINAHDYTEYGDLLKTMGQDTAAVAYYEKAVEVAPDKTSLLKDLSSAYSNAKMYDKSADAMAQFIDSEGDDANPNDILALARRYQNLAISYMETDTTACFNSADKALATIDKVIARIPDNPTVLNTKSDILRVRSLGNVTPEVVEADKATLTVLDSDPSNLEKRKNIYRAVYSRLGNYYMTVKDMDNARLYFQKFYEIEPSDALKEFIETHLQ